MIRVFSEETGALILEVDRLHCQTREEVHGLNVAGWHGRLSFYDIDQHPTQGRDARICRVVDGAGAVPIVFLGCRLRAFSLTPGEDGKQAVQLAFTYERVCSFAQWQREQEPVRIDN